MFFDASYLGSISELLLKVGSLKPGLFVINWSSSLAPDRNTTIGIVSLNIAYAFSYSGSIFYAESNDNRWNLLINGNNSYQNDANFPDTQIIRFTGNTLNTPFKEGLTLAQTGTILSVFAEPSKSTEFAFNFQIAMGAGKGRQFYIRGRDVNGWDPWMKVFSVENSFFTGLVYNTPIPANTWTKIPGTTKTLDRGIYIVSIFAEIPSSSMQTTDNLIYVEMDSNDQALILSERQSTHYIPKGFSVNYHITHTFVLDQYYWDTNSFDVWIWAANAITLQSTEFQITRIR